MREMTEFEVRRGFCRSSAGISTWTGACWIGCFCQGSTSFTAGSHKLSIELTELCELEGFEKQ